MRPAPHLNDDYAERELDEIVMDPLADSTLQLWEDTARRNREIFTEVFRPVPTNLVRDWSAYEVRITGPGPPHAHLDRFLRVHSKKQRYLPMVKAGHVVPGLDLERVKQRLAMVKGSLVDSPMVCFVAC
jgi:phospholipase D1/2